MTATIGHFSLVVALVVAVYGVVASVLGARRRQEAFTFSGQTSAWAVLGLLTVAVVAMEYALLTHDFSIEYVANNHSRETPLLFTIIALWGALEGSILFWAWLLAIYTSLVVYSNWRKHQELMPYVTATLLTLNVFFLGLMAGPANPFRQIFPVPENGTGPNPLLQNHYLMAVHPPMLYLGFVGFSVPYAFAMAALFSGRLREDWLFLIRRWLITAWAFLSMGILLGGWWSYEVLGWGGYWAWDPVENASFLPWLTATAFLHSVMVQERRRMLKVWNLTLVIVTFALTLFGTFLTRSGILSSVHAFSLSVIGPLFLSFIGALLLGSISVLVWRGDKLKDDAELDGAVSRESAFLVNNLLLVGFAFAVLVGTMFPLVVEAIQGTKISVGAPFFNQVNVPIALALLFLMGVGPLLPWRRTPPEVLRQRFLLPGIGAMLVGVLGYVLGITRLAPLLTCVLAAFIVVGMGQDLVVAVSARRRSSGEGPLVALGQLVARNRRRYGGFVVHLGVVLIALGIAMSSAFSQQRESTLRTGGSLAIAGYSVQLVEVRGYQEPQRLTVASSVAIEKDGRLLGTLEPALRFYPSLRTPVATPAVHSTLAEDLYLTLTAVEPDGSSATITALVKPMVAWIWLGGGVVLIGALIAIWPTPRRQVG
ncbi:MAG: heme lyase CcmF/NrfE family subunit [Deinococcus sp.]|nr:heme lyase CcmF/NrfE family subunit [Deinococcus sp.]